MAQPAVPNKPEKASEGVNPYREEYLDANYPGIRKTEYKKKDSKRRGVPKHAPYCYSFT